jgi:vacuolar-type H+-ATPase subunit C/Vma6
MNRASPARGPAALGTPFEFLNAKLRARRSRIYAGESLRRLTRLGTPRELADRLYRRHDVQGAVELERRLAADCVADLAWPLRYLEGAYRAFYAALLELYRVENLKALLRLLAATARPEPERYLVELPRALALPAGALSGAQSAREFVELVPVPAVRRAAKAVLPRYRETGRRAYLEMAFDRGYWQGVWEALERLPGRVAAQCAGPLRRERAAMCLLGTLRAAGTYELPWGDWVELLPPGGDGPGPATLREVYERPTVEFARERLAWVDEALRRHVPPADSADLWRLEEALWHETVRAADRQYYAQMSGPAVLVSYYYLKREELRHLLGITQMLRYGKGEREISEYLEL